MTPPDQSPAPTDTNPLELRSSPVFFGSASDPGTRQLTAGMEVIEAGVYRGPHYYSHTPMVRIQLDLGRLEPLAGLLGGHLDELVLLGDPEDQLARLGVARHDRGIAVAIAGGLVAAIEYEPFAGKPGARGFDTFVRAFDANILVRAAGDITALSPPLIIEKSHIDELVGTLGKVIRETKI